MLTPSQYQALKADILADSTLNSQPNNSDGAFAIAEAYNLPASPSWILWRTQVPAKDCKIAVSWTELIGRSQGERDAWIFMLSDGVINAADINVRQGIQDIFSGAGGAVSRAALIAIAKTTASRVQKLFSTGTGDDANPATMDANITETFKLSFQDVEAARRLP